MAQKTEKKEETEFKVPVPETITTTIVPCVNNCGLPATADNKMCQNCSAAATTTSSSAAGASSQPQTSRSARSPKRPFPEEENSSTAPAADPPRRDEAAPSEAKRVVNRCSGCRRRVGLTGFRCRCGDLFCAEHRYSDRHDCSFDYKAAGREAIARENPVIRAAKILKV